MEKKENYYLKNKSVKVTKYFSKKGGLDYLPWSKSWDFAKKEDPSCNYIIRKNPINGYNYFTNHNSGGVRMSLLTMRELMKFIWRLLTIEIIL